MLAHLKVRDLALIENLDVELARGFNALTGETGAGKSLVVTALDLLLGRRAKSDLVRKGADEAEVEGLFVIEDEPEVRRRLVEAGLPDDEELLVRRVIPANGRHRCYVNGHLSSLSVLKNLAQGLATVMGQHEHHTLFDPQAQLDLLDGFAKNAALRTQMTEAYEIWRAADERQRDLLGKARDRAARLDYLRFQLAEIDEADPRAGELDELDDKIDMLRHQGVLLGAAQGSADELYERDGSIFERLGAIGRSLDDAARFDKRLADQARQLQEAAALVEDTARTLSGYGDSFEDDPRELSRLEDRREALRALTRKHGTNLEGIVELRENFAREISVLSGYEESLAGCEREVREAKEAAVKKAKALGAERRKAARAMGEETTRELRDLSFKGAVFEVALEDARDLLSTGLDKVELMVMPNPGEGMHPIRSVASGGELSRIMLALKRVLAGVGPVGTYVFDEVDAGIGGNTANAVGNKLSQVSAHHQVICITHLPQISALADAHFLVKKDEKKGRTATSVVALSEDARVEEITRMLGGEASTDKMRDAARELIAAGRRS